MKNRGFKISSLITVFALLFTMLVIPVQAEDNNITLTGDRAETLTVEIGETVVLDLNGHDMTGKIINNGTLTIKGEGKISVTGDNVIFNKGTLTIKSGTFDALSHAKAALWNDLGGIVTINGGTFLRSLENGSSTVASGGNSFYNILNHGTMTFNNGSVIQSGRYSSLVENGWQTGGQNTTKTDSIMVINNGMFQGGLNTIKNDDYGNLTIKGGSFTNVAQASLLNWNVAKIEGGIFESDKRVILNGFGDAGMDKGELTIIGGIFNSGGSTKTIEQMGGSDSIGTIAVTGGSYNNPLGIDLAKEYKFVEENGRKVVTAKVPGLVLSETKTALLLGSPKTLSVTRSDAISGEVVWASSDPTVATVDAGGVITSLKSGVTTISASADGKRVSCEVSIYTTANPTLPKPPVNTGSDTTITVNDKTAQVMEKTLSNLIENLVTSSAVSADTKTKLEEAIKAGKEITVSAETKKVDAKSVDKAVVSKVEKVIAANAKIAQYFDLTMMLKGAGEELGTLNEMSEVASFTVTVPKDLTKVGRTFYMVRVHEGVAEKLQGTLKGNDFTFDTDKFSLYALVYEDSKSVDTDDKTTVNTGDTTNTLTLFMLMGGASLVFAGLFLKRKYENK